MRERNGYVFDHPAGVIAAFEDMLSRSEEIVGRQFFKAGIDSGPLRADISKIHDYLDDLVERLQVEKTVKGLASGAITLWDGAQHHIQDTLANEVIANALDGDGIKSVESDASMAAYREVRRTYMSVGRRVERLPAFQRIYAEFWPVELDVLAYLKNWQVGSDTIKRLDRQSTDGLRYEGPRDAIEHLKGYCATVHRVLGPAIAHIMRQAFLSERADIR